MTSLDLILHALNAQPTPNMTNIVAGNSLQDRKHALHHLLRQKLADSPDAEAMLTRYREQPAVWEGVLRDALLQNGIATDPDVIDRAYSVIELTNPSDPAWATRPMSEDEISNILMGQAPDFDGEVQSQD